MRLRLDPLAQNGISTVVDNTAVVNVGGSTTTSGATSLADLTDVDSSVSSPSDGDIIVYRDAGSDWVLEAKPAGGSNPALNDVTDVTISAVGDNEVLAYDTGTSTWINQTASEAGLAASSHSHTATDVTDFDTEVSNNTDVAANTAARHAALTVTDSAEIDFTLTGQDLTASIKAGSIDETKLDTTTNASLDLADSAVQPGDLATVATTGSYSDLSNTPTLGTAAAKNIPATGDASATEVVYGTDTRLTDARTPTSHTHPTTDLTATGGTSTSFLRKDNTWATPTNTTYSEISEAEITTGTATTLRTITGRRAGFLKNTDNHVSGTTNKVYTATEQSKLAGIADGATANTGTVTSVAATVPTGMTVSGSPVTTTGTLALGYDTGYQGYTTTEASKLAGIETGAQVNTVASVNTKTGTVVINPDDLDDTSTTNKFTTAGDISKLAGIEAGADVTDATNVDSAGATMNSDTTLAGNGYFLDEDTMTSNDATKVASQQSIKAYVDSAITAAKAALFPVGAIYVSGVATNPATLLGFGTWTQIEGKFLVGVSTTDTDFDLDDTGGAKDVTLTVAEMPSHTHTQNAHTHVQDQHRHLITSVAIGATRNYTTFGTDAGIVGNRWSDYTTATNQNTTATNQNTGGDGAHENLPPYIAKYIWQRTA